MGMPAPTFYPLVYNLASPERPYHGQALRVVRPFSLFAFVICHPDDNGGVREVLARHFSFLDVATADRLLFFAPIDAPPGWREQQRQRGVAATLRDLYEEIDPHWDRSADPRQTEHTLATSLGLGLDELPTIVLTTDLRRPRYVALRTCAEHVRRQLVALGDFAQDLPPLGERGEGAEVPLTPEDLRWRGLDLCQGVAAPELVSSLADALHTVLSLALANRDFRAASSAPRALLALRQQIELARSAVHPTGPDAPEGAEEGLERVLQLEECLAAWLALYRGLAAPQGSRVEGWDPESQRWLDLGDRVAGMLDAANPAMAQVIDAADFSPAAVCWAKAFEAELNHSLGHWVRGLLGVELPPYYDRVQDGVEAVFVGSEGRFRVDFNRRRRPGEEAWLPPELGALRGPVAHYLKRTPEPPLPPAGQEALLAGWETVRQVRNDACHPHAVPRPRAALLRDTLTALDRERILLDLAQLKHHLRGDALRPTRTQGVGDR